MQIWLTQSRFSSNELAKNIAFTNPKICPLLINKKLPAIRCTLTDNTLVFLTSKTAIYYWVQQYPIPKNVVVVGRASLEYAKSFGIAAKFLGKEGSEGLVAAIDIPKDMQIIVASAKKSRGIIENDLNNFGYKYSKIDLYENLPNNKNIGIICDQIVDFDLVLIASNQALEHMLKIYEDKPLVWLVFATRLAKKLLNNLNNGVVICANSSEKLGDIISKCYLDRVEKE